MQCPKCQFEQDDLRPECQRCGILFAKFQKRQHQCEKAVLSLFSEEDVETVGQGHLLEFFCPLPRDVNKMSVVGRAVVYVVLLVWGVQFIFSSIDGNYAGRSFMHLINLPFHEAGHIFFSPFGSFLTSLGGSLGQMLMPLVCLFVLLFKTGDGFGGSVCLWWFGQNFFDLAPYLNDARSGTLPLIGGNFGHSSPYGFHDWQYLLTETGLLKQDHFLAGTAVVVGTGIMLLSFVWGGYLLFQQYKACM